MKGEWVQDPVTEVWHVITERDLADGSVMTWCDKEFQYIGGPQPATIKGGHLITFMDICHDECVRKSEEL